MTTIAVSHLHHSLSEYVDRVRGGEEIVLTADGVPVAKIVPVEHCENGQGDIPSNGVVRQVCPPEQALPAGFFNDLAAGHDPDRRILAYLLEGRENGR